MSVEECITKYNDFMKNVFDLWEITKTKNYLLNGAQYDTGTLEKIVKNLIKDKLNDDEVDLFDAKNSPCKVYYLPLFALI